MDKKLEHFIASRIRDHIVHVEGGDPETGLGAAHDIPSYFVAVSKGQSWSPTGKQTLFIVKNAKGNEARLFPCDQDNGDFLLEQTHIGFVFYKSRLGFTMILGNSEYDFVEAGK